MKTNQLTYGRTLVKTFSGLFEVKRIAGRYNVYHKADGFIIQCSTQRQIRNAIRAYMTNKTKTVAGRE